MVHRRAFDLRSNMASQRVVDGDDDLPVRRQYACDQLEKFQADLVRHPGRRAEESMERRMMLDPHGVRCPNHARDGVIRDAQDPPRQQPPEGLERRGGETICEHSYQ